MSRTSRGVLAAGLLLSLASCINARKTSDGRWKLEPSLTGPARPECEKLRLSEVGLKEERSLGEAMATRVVAARGGLALGQTGDARGEAARARRVALVGTALAHVSARPQLPWRFGVLESGEVNAVSSPGGFVFVTRGALSRVENEDQLAGILAHEVAHVTGRHALERYGDEKARVCEWVQFSREHVQTPFAEGSDGEPPSFSDNPFWQRHLPGYTQYIDRLVKGVTVDFDDQVLVPVLTVLSEKLVDGQLRVGLDKELEFHADAEAVDLLLALGYRPEEFIRFVGQLPHDGDVFSHHPGPEARQAAMTAHLAKRRAEENPLRPPARTVPVPLPAELAH